MLEKALKFIDLVENSAYDAYVSFFSNKIKNNQKALKRKEFILCSQKQCLRGKADRISGVQIKGSLREGSPDGVG